MAEQDQMNENDGFEKSAGVSHSHGWDTYPLDSVFVRTEQRTVVEVARRIRAGRYDLNPEFQRDFIWPLDKQSRLIESCLMRLPLPVLYVAEAPDGRIIVVDGLQRLTTFKRFLDGEFSLELSAGNDKEKPQESPLNGKSFDDLHISLQERIEDTQLILYILDANAPERAKLDIFERVNGGVPLTRQQMRNCLHNGKATQWLADASKLKSFKTVMSITFSKKTMRDREVVNRFCGFKTLGVKEYKGDMDGFLAQTLETMNQMDPNELSALQDMFDISMKNNKFIFGRHAFRKSIKGLFSSGGRRSVINVALFDVCSVLFSELEEEDVKTHKKAIQKSFANLLVDTSFLSTISSGTAKKSSVEKRFRMAREALEGAISC